MDKKEKHQIKTYEPKEKKSEISSKIWSLLAIMFIGAFLNVGVFFAFFITSHSLIFSLMVSGVETTVVAGFLFILGLERKDEH